MLLHHIVAPRDIHILLQIEPPRIRYREPPGAATVHDHSLVVHTMVAAAAAAATAMATMTMTMTNRVKVQVWSPAVGDVLGAVPPVAAAVLVVRVAPVAAGSVHVLAVGRGCWNGGKLWQNGNWGIIGNILTTT